MARRHGKWSIIWSAAAGALTMLGVLGGWASEALGVEERPVGQASGILMMVDPQQQTITMRKSWVTPTASDGVVEQYLLNGNTVIADGLRRRGLEALRAGDQITVEYYADGSRLVARTIHRATAGAG